MARLKPKKKPATKSGKKRFTRLEYLNRLGEQYINVRYCEAADDAEMDERVLWLSLVPQSDAADAEYAALLQSMRWQIVTVTICRSPDGKEYHLISYAKTVQSLVAWREGITPLVRRVVMDAEKNMNGKHCFARATLFTPVGRGNRHIADIVKSQMKFLHLYPEDIDAIRELADKEEDDVRFTIDQFDDLDVEDKIKVLFREEEVSSSRVADHYALN